MEVLPPPTSLATTSSIPEPAMADEIAATLRAQKREAIRKAVEAQRTELLNRRSSIGH